MAVTQLLIDSGAQVQARNHQAVTPLHLAAANHQLEVAQALLQHGADPNAQTTFGATPLDLAIKFGRLQDPIVALLRNHGGKRCLETRLIKWEIFSSRLKHYYEQSESEVEFSFAEDGSCIESFNVWPKDTPYCIPKVSLHREAAFQDEALATLKAIFFPKEAIWIHEISQGGTNGDVFLEVEIIEEAVNDPGGKWPLAVAVNPEPMS